MLERVGLAKQIKMMITGCEPEPEADETNVTIERDGEDHLMLSIQVTKASGRIFHTRARVPFESLLSSMHEVTKTEKISG